MPKVQTAAGGTGRGRRGRMVASTALAEINVVPLVDVMLVLLIIFMVAAPMMQKGVEVNLPVSRRADKMTNTDPLYVTVPTSFRKDRRVQIGEEFVVVDVLAERMRQAMMNRADKQVFLRGDGAVQLQELMDVFGRLKEAGIEKVGIVAQERRAER
jgi:biopolymer transport protein TolR